MMTRYSLLMIAAAFLLSTNSYVFAASENDHIILIKSDAEKADKKAKKKSAEEAQKEVDSGAVDDGL